MSKHNISICLERGVKCKRAMKVDLCECMSALCRPENTKEEKNENFLLFPAYSSTMDEYWRNEGCLDRFSVMVVDCDNGEDEYPSTWDKNIVEKFKERMESYDYLVYETASSTKERPKFRAIVPIDAELPWSRHAKTAIYHRFREFADDRASWFFSPNTSKLGTIVDHDVGREFPSRALMEDIEVLAMNEQIEATNRALEQSKREMWSVADAREWNPEGWRFLPSVKKCLEGLRKGERDNSLNAACYAMDKNGYKSEIGQFLSEVVCDNEIKRKFYNKYR